LLRFASLSCFTLYCWRPRRGVGPGHLHWSKRSMPRPIGFLFCASGQPSLVRRALSHAPNEPVQLLCGRPPPPGSGPLPEERRPVGYEGQRCPGPRPRPVAFQPRRLGSWVLLELTSAALFVGWRRRARGAARRWWGLPTRPRAILHPLAGLGLSKVRLFLSPSRAARLLRRGRPP